MLFWKTVEVGGNKTSDMHLFCRSPRSILREVFASIGVTFFRWTLCQFVISDLSRHRHFSLCVDGEAREVFCVLFLTVVSSTSGVPVSSHTAVRKITSLSEQRTFVQMVFWNRLISRGLMHQYLCDPNFRCDIT